MEILEGATFGCGGEDLDYLIERLRGFLERRADGWAVTRLVGHLQLPSGEVLHIRSPKAKTASLLAWLAYVDPSLRSLRQLGRLPKALSEGGLAAVVARLFLAAVLDAAARHGLIREYRRVHVRTSTVRGRIEFDRVARLGGDISRLPCLVWERLPETPLNRFLAAVINVVSLDPIMKTSSPAKLAQARSLLAAVRPGVPSALLDGKTALARNERPFEAAVSLGRLILRHSALAEGQERAGFAFLVNLEALFEKTIVRAFREAGVEAMAKAPVNYRRGPGNWTTGVMEMDLFCPSLAGGLLVVDAKYKTSVSSGNLQQMVTYCFVTGARRAVLVLPAGHLTDRRSYFFSAGGGHPGEQVTVNVAELDTDATDVAGWRQSAQMMVAEVVGIRRRSQSGPIVDPPRRSDAQRWQAGAPNPSV